MEYPPVLQGEMLGLVRLLTAAGNFELHEAAVGSGLAAVVSPALPGRVGTRQWRPGAILCMGGAWSGRGCWLQENSPVFVWRHSLLSLACRGAVWLQALSQA